MLQLVSLFLSIIYHLMTESVSFRNAVLLLNTVYRWEIMFIT